MERMMKSIKAALFAGILVVALSSCVNPFDWMAVVSDEVMLAKDMYLEVVDTSPDYGPPHANTWEPINVTFDRDIDEATLSETTILFRDQFDAEVAWTPGYNPATRVATLLPDGLAGDITFTITITSGVKGTDGSSLRDPYAWSFKTVPSPSGTVTINDPISPSGFINSASVTLTVTKNIYVEYFRVCAADAAGDPTFLSGGKDALDWVDKDSVGPWPLTNYPATLLGTQGTNTIFIQYMDSAYNMSPENAISADIVFDNVVPEMDAGTMAWLNNATPSRTANASASDLTSGILSCAWSGAGLTFSNPGILAPTISASADGTYTATLLVTDKAGNTKSDTVAVNRDITLPVITTFVINSNNTYTNSLTTTLTINASDANMDLVRYSNEGDTWSSWEAYVTSKTWTLPTGDGKTAVYYEVRDDAGNVKQVRDLITLDVTPPTVSVFTIGSGNPASTNLPAVTLYITATDATSGVYQSRYGNAGDPWTAWEAYATSRAWTLIDTAGTRRVYLGVSDKAGNTTALNGTWDEIVLLKRIIISYAQLYIADDGDFDVLGLPVNGEIYYRFYVDGALKLNRSVSSYLSIADPAMISSSLPPSSYTVFKDPASGSLTMTGQIFDDDSGTPDSSAIWSRTFAVPYVDSLNQTGAIGGAPGGTIYYSFDVQN